MKNLNVMIKVLANKLATGAVVRGINISENGGTVKIGEISLNCHSGYNPVEVVLKAFGDMSAFAPDNFEMSQKCDMDFELTLRDVDVRKGRNSFKFEEIVITSLFEAFEVLSQFEIIKIDKEEEPVADVAETLEAAADEKSEDVVAPAADEKSIDDQWLEGNKYI